MDRRTRNSPGLIARWLGFALFSGAGVSLAGAAPPARPVGLEGYRLSFSDEFNSIASIAADQATNPRAQWFRARFFGDLTTAASTLSIKNGVLTMTGTQAQPAHIQSAAPSGGNAGWVGRAFRNGAYFEARIAVGADSLATASGWPSFWSMAIEHMPLRGAAQWPGQPIGYMRFIENDFFEYNPAWNREAYFATLWEWYGRWELCSKGRWCDQSNADDPRRVIPLPKGRKWSDFNVYGQKWVPETGKQIGYVQNYLNGRAVGPRVTWRSGDATPPSSIDVRFNIMDRQGLMLVLATGGQPMRIDWVRVWQPKTGRVERRQTDDIPSGDPPKR